MLRNGGWQILTDRPVNISNGVPTTAVGLKSSAVLGYTDRFLHHAMFAADHVVLVYGNWSADGSETETPGECTIRVNAALQKNGATGVTDETGVRVPVTFSGKSYVDIPPNGLVFSDPTPFEVIANEVFFVRNQEAGAGTGYLLANSSTGLGGTTGTTGVNNGEGAGAEDLVMSGNVTQSTASFSYGPVAVLGFSSAKQKSIAIFGDSIAASTGDAGYYRACGGYLTRLAVNMTQLAIDNTFAVSGVANFPFVKSARGGYTLANFATRSKSFKQIKLGELATTAVVEYGVNDLAGTLAAMKANALIVAGWFTSRGVKIIWTTITPRTTSTDNWKTANNQTVTANEATRTGFNDWLRDATATGFVSQAGGNAAVWDAAALIEVNASNVLTLDGGFWQAAISASDATGTSTAATSASITNSGLSLTQDQYRGYCLSLTSGAGSGQTQAILGNTATVISLAASFSPAPSGGDTYLIFRPQTIDGTHPSSTGHQTIANGLNTANNLAKVA